MDGMNRLVELSRKYGQDPAYVLAGGGNTSYKKDGVMAVKGSGTSLATIGAEQFVCMDMGKLSAMLERDYPADDAEREALALADMMAARLPGEESKRPSVEAILHAIFPFRFVLHLHPALVNGLTCGTGGEALCRELLGEEAVWIPITKPGYILALVCKQAFDAYKAKTGKAAQILVMQNHGIFVAADDTADIDAMMASVMEKLAARVERQPDFTPVEFDRQLACSIAPALRMIYAGDGKAVGLFLANRETQRLTADAHSMDVLLTPFTPDHIVYCKAKPLYLSAGDDYKAKFDAFVSENGYKPKVMAVQGLGFFVFGATKKEAEIAKLLLLDAIKIAVYSQSFGGALPMAREYVDFILSWEVENYRQKVSLSGGGDKRLEGKIAVVTGSAQGFGQGIARSMAAQGAYVVIADLNADGAKACADGLNSEYGAGTAVSVAANVADEASVKAMVETCVLEYGGLDVFVSNAGIAIAGSLEEMTRERFELVTSVNYTGYFLCAKYASAVMKIQRQYNPEYLMDIIEINSKSGLEGSNKNFAYAGSKFGGVGLTQSFALELVPYGIKVNAICPGNLLDGPLWSDPEKGLFKQYFEAGKVPGAQSIADVRKFYESKVPMNRGCTTDDVAVAILYVIEQKYETGQAIPVTGGQIMLK
ncbi:SDR family oxidoreductase [Ruminococcaceae bacterium OttesenSCG-928-L11]|nr:SDR family oxidoreductase [Ruminococcaceae bacterium OttesenSCG-928-L11]